MQEAKAFALSSPLFRFAEADYFFSRFVESCGPPSDSYFRMVCYFDAFLFTLISIEEMVAEDVKKKLNSKPVFKFLKAMRNISTHHSVLGAALSDSKFPRPFYRVINASIGGPPNDSSRLNLRFDILKQIFQAIEKERPSEKKNLTIARKHIAEREFQSPGEFPLVDEMKSGLDEVRSILTMTP